MLKSLKRDTFYLRFCHHHKAELDSFNPEDPFGSYERLRQNGLPPSLLDRWLCTHAESCLLTVSKEKRHTLLRFMKEKLQFDGKKKTFKSETEQSYREMWNKGSLEDKALLAIDIALYFPEFNAQVEALYLHATPEEAQVIENTYRNLGISLPVLFAAVIASQPDEAVRVLVELGQSHAEHFAEVIKLRFEGAGLMKVTEDYADLIQSAETMKPAAIMALLSCFCNDHLALRLRGQSGNLLLGPVLPYLKSVDAGKLKGFIEQFTPAHWQAALQLPVNTSSTKILGEHISESYPMFARALKMHIGSPKMAPREIEPSSPATIPVTVSRDSSNTSLQLGAITEEEGYSSDSDQSDASPRATVNSPSERQTFAYCGAAPQAPMYTSSMKKQGESRLETNSMLSHSLEMYIGLPDMAVREREGMYPSPVTISRNPSLQLGSITETQEDSYSSDSDQSDAPKLAP